MNLSDLKPFPEEKKERKRVGRGSATGWGCTCGKGNKGQRSRSGYKQKAGFEGGQMPLYRRLPKRGFKNPFRTEYEAINLDTLLAAFEGEAAITLEAIYAKGLCKKGSPVKILGRGEGKAVTVEAHRFSATAMEKLSQAGGAAKSLEGQDALSGASAAAETAETTQD